VTDLIERPATSTPPTSTPQWLLQAEPALCPCGCIGKRHKGSFVEKTLRGGAGVLRQVMFSDDTAARSGLLQRIDPRVKVLTMVGLLLAAGFVHSSFVLAGLYALTLAAAAASGLPLGFFVKRVWLFVPIFTGIVVLPATLSIVTPGHLVVPLWTWDGTAEGITTQGLATAARLVLRVAVSISIVVLVTLTTSWARLLAGLRALGVPKMFILVIGMAYRYLFHLLTVVMDMYEARKARTIGKQKHDRAARGFVAATAGVTVGKSHQLAEEVHQAMTARGFRGNAKTLDAPRLSLRDAVCLALAAAIAFAALFVDGLLV
jgi:cobalt/nickel transport system permease protein